MYGSHALYVNRDCLKCILGMNLPPTNKNLFIILFILYPQNKIEPNMGTSFKGILNAKLLNNPLDSCSLIDPRFIQLPTGQFNITIIFQFVFLSKPCVFTFLTFLHFKQ